MQSKKVVIPDAERAHGSRGCSVERSQCESVHPSGENHRASRGNCPGPIAIIVESPIAEIHRISPADPIPELKHVGTCRCRTWPLLWHSSKRRQNVWRRLRDFSEPPAARSRALCALVIVSSVLNVFDEMMKSVSSGLRSRTASTKSVPSTFDTKRKVIAAIVVMFRAPHMPSPARGRIRRFRY